MQQACGHVLRRHWHKASGACRTLGSAHGFGAGQAFRSCRKRSDRQITAESVLVNAVHSVSIPHGRKVDASGFQPMYKHRARRRNLDSALNGVSDAVQPIPNLQETTAYYVTTTSPAHSTRQETCRRSTWLSVGYRYKVRADQEKNKNRKGVIKQLYMAKLEVHRTPMAERPLWVSGQTVLDKQNLHCIFPASYELQSMDAIACLSSCMSGHVMVIRSMISFMTALP